MGRSVKCNQCPLRSLRMVRIMVAWCAVVIGLGLLSAVPNPDTTNCNWVEEWVV